MRSTHRNEGEAPQSRTHPTQEPTIHNHAHPPPLPAPQVLRHSRTPMHFTHIDRFLLSYFSPTRIL